MERKEKVSFGFDIHFCTCSRLYFLPNFGAVVCCYDYSLSSFVLASSSFLFSLHFFFFLSHGSS